MSNYRENDFWAEDVEFFKGLNSMVAGVCKFAPHPISALSNVAATLYDQLQYVNWAGFYLAADEKLLVGPFQGKPACTEIPFGKGVCGTAVQTREVMIVDDVHSFPGHIACDVSSKSEIVVPLISSCGQGFGVLDIDSPMQGRFRDFPRDEIKELASVVANYLAKVRFKFVQDRS